MQCTKCNSKGNKIIVVYHKSQHIILTELKFFQVMFYKNVLTPISIKQQALWTFGVNVIQDDCTKQIT